MTWFWHFDSFDSVPVVLLQLKMWERENRTVTVIFDPTSVTAEFEVWICRNYGETVGVDRSATANSCALILVTKLQELLLNNMCGWLHFKLKAHLNTQVMQKSSKLHLKQNLFAVCFEAPSLVSKLVFYTQSTSAVISVHASQLLELKWL